MNTQIIVAILGSTGLWTLINNIITYIKDKKSIEKKALLALLHDKMYYLCQHFINKGEITTDELENLEYLYKPYSALGGNGTCKRLYEEVLRLPITKG